MARVIIDGAIAFTREQNLNMAVVVVDAAGNLVSADKMDGTKRPRSRPRQRNLATQFS